MKSKNILNKQKKSNKNDIVSDSELNEDYNGVKNQPAYLKSSNRFKPNLKEHNQIILEYSSNETDIWLNPNNQQQHNNINHIFNSTSYKLNSKSVPNDIALSNPNDDDHQIKIKPFSNEICRNLEKMLNKMQKSFDPFKLKDENLKFTILKEILECQRLLLTYNLFSKDNATIKNTNSNREQNIITINEIYDEWKILAMVVDRICFVFYLLALIISSVLFIASEQDLFEP